MGQTTNMHSAADGFQGLEIRLLGAIRFNLCGQPLKGLRSRKGEALLALLALRNSADLPRSWIAGVLWPDSSHERQHFYLRRELSNLRSALGPEAWRIESPNRDCVRFNPMDARIDVLEFDQACLGRDRATMERAVALYDGALMEAMDWEWVLIERTRREHAFMDLLSDMASQALQSGRHAEAVPLLRRAISIEPLRESLHRSLFTALAELRDYGALVKAHRNLRQILARELGVDPSQETEDLVRRIRARARAQDQEDSTETLPFDPEASCVLPTMTTRLFGREADREQVLGLLRTVRGVVLTGSGGVGKTSLSILVAREFQPEMADGVQFVSLATIQDDALVPLAVSQALGIGQRPGSDPMATLAHTYANKRALLVLDNCEQVADGVATLMEALLHACPSVKFLASSRHTIRADGVFNWRVPSLEVPEIEAMRLGTQASIQVFERNPSVSCFIDRASQIGAPIKLSASSVRDIARICRRLDGIPLAIELAAAWASSMPLAQLEAKLADRFRLLSRGGKRDLPRQATLRAAIDWSIRLLSPDERDLFLRLAVFSGGWTLDAAEEVCSNSPAERQAVPRVLSSLVEKSLVVFEPDKGEGRYRLLETLREYALEEQRDSEALQPVRSRHFVFFYRFAADYEPLLYERESVMAQRTLFGEMDNLEAAQDYCLLLPALSEPLPGVSAALASLHLVRMLQRLNFVRGSLEKSHVRALRAIERAAPHVTGSDLAWAYVSAAVCANFRGLVGEASDLLATAIDLGRVSGDSKVVARALYNQGWVLFRQGQLENARACLNEALEKLGPDGEPMWRGLILHYLTDTDLAVGAYCEAEAHAGQALRACEGKGCSLVEGYVLMNVGITDMAFGRLASARGHLMRSIQIHRELGDRFHRGKSQLWLARLSLLEGKVAESQAVISEAAQMLFDIASELEMIQCLELGAELAAALGHFRTAEGLVRLAAKRRLEMGTPTTPVEAERIEGLKRMLGSGLGTPEPVRDEEAEVLNTISDAFAAIQDLCRVPC